MADIKDTTEAEREAAEPDPGEVRPMGLIDRDTAPGLMRLTVGAWWRTGVWTAETTYRASKRLAQAATSGDSAVELMEDAQREMAGALRALLGIREEDPD